jgi:uncharacterized Tic20 family protein
MDLSVTQDERNWGMGAHLAGLAGYIIPFGHLIGPLIVWQAKKELPFVDDQGREAMNFQLSLTLYMFIASLLFLVGVGPFVLGALGLYGIAMIIIASVKANQGVKYRYPFILRMLK